jgi:hypothetical protein
MKLLVALWTVASAAAFSTQVRVAYRAFAKSAPFSSFLSAAPYVSVFTPSFPFR